MNEIGKIANWDVQSFPSADGHPEDPFEALVATYYELEGYLTSGNKWFWVRDPNKHQRGYSDIDVLAVSASETVMVSVTSNLDDKITAGRLGKKKLEELVEYYEKVEHYLQSVPEYKWLLKGRSTKRVLAFASGRKDMKPIEDMFKPAGIKLLSGEEVLGCIEKWIDEHAGNFKTKSDLIKTVAFMTGYGVTKTR